MAEVIVNGYLTENSENSTKTAFSNKKPSKKQTRKQPKKQPKFNIPEFPSQVVENVFKALKMNRKAKYSWLADNLGVSERTIQRAIDDLKKMGYINSEHSKVKGEWQLLK